MPLKYSPLWEMSLAIQTSELGGLTPQQAIDFRAHVADEYPLVELHPPLGPLGAEEDKHDALPSLQPRWWFVSQDQERLLQIQSDTLAVNWRHRGDIGDRGRSYPGFDAMIECAQKHLPLWYANSGVSELVRPACNLFYDNIWLVSDEQTTAQIFRFWNHLGVYGNFLGPEVFWSIALQDDRLSGPTTLQLNAAMGHVQSDAGVHRVARVRLSGTAHSVDEPGMWIALSVMHEQIRKYLDLLVTDETRAKWQG